MPVTPGIMKYVLIWLENDEQIVGFVQHAIEEAGRPDRNDDYVLRSGTRQPVHFAGFMPFRDRSPGRNRQQPRTGLDPPDQGTGDAGYATEILLRPARIRLLAAFTSTGSMRNATKRTVPRPT